MTVASGLQYQRCDAGVAAINEVLVGVIMTRVFFAGVAALFLATGAVS
jgi:hypothetical protein